MNAAIPEHKSMTEEISGLIERVTFHNDESGFCVLRVRTRGQRDETTVIGSLPSVTAGEWPVAEGWWVRDKEHGLQFKAKSLKTVPPTTVEGIVTSPTPTSPTSPFGEPSVMGLICSALVCSEQISRKRHFAAQSLRSVTRPVRVFEVLISGNVLSTELKLV